MQSKPLDNRSELQPLLLTNCLLLQMSIMKVYTKYEHYKVSMSVGGHAFVYVSHNILLFFCF